MLNIESFAEPLTEDVVFSTTSYVFTVLQLTTAIVMFLLCFKGFTGFEE